MAATIAQAIGANSIAPESASHLYVACVDVTGDASYPTGGYAVTLSTYLPTGARVLHVAATPKGAVTTAFMPAWDGTNNKLQLFASNGAAPAALAEVANATNVATSVTRLIVFYEAV